MIAYEFLALLWPHLLDSPNFAGVRDYITCLTTSLEIKVARSTVASYDPVHSIGVIMNETGTLVLIRFFWGLAFAVWLNWLMSPGKRFQAELVQNLLNKECCLRWSDI